MDDILSILTNPDMDISAFFKQYDIRKKSQTLYSKDDHIPQNLIKLYYLDENHLDFKVIIDWFKKKTIYNENEIENVHDKDQRDGLAVVYDEIENGKFEKIKSIYVILLIHQSLFSKVPYANYGGKFRNYNCFITDSDVPTSDYSGISLEISNLNNEYVEILEMANMINASRSSNMLIDYIKKCIDLKCKLIKIHPFADGNGRTCRAMVNILFKEVGLPPIYVMKSEKEDYIKAMNMAITGEDNSSIYKFYYYKICDSIYDLDIANRIDKEDKKTK